MQVSEECHFAEENGDDRTATVAKVTYGSFATFVAADEARDRLVRYLLEAAALLDDDPACRAYIIGTADEHAVSVFEVWDDEGAHESSLQRQDVRAIIDAACQLIADIRATTSLDICGGKGG